MPMPHPYELLAALLDYPTEGTAALLETGLADFRLSWPQAAELLASLHEYVRENRLESVQELYTHTFDLQPVCTLDIGYHLFGESYERGRFLARLRQSQEEAGLREEHELPDHLPIVLRWLARVYGTEDHSEMIQECVLPALSKMENCLAGGTNPYLGLLRAVAMVLKSEGPVSEPAQWRPVRRPAAPAHPSPPSSHAVSGRSGDRGHYSL